MEPEEFAERLAHFADRLVQAAGGAAVSAKDDDLPFWRIEPVRWEASPLWFAGESEWDLTVGFGRADSRVELGFSAKVSADEALTDLEDYCMAVIAGGLVERRKGSRASRWHLTFRDGSTDHGSTNWLLPAFPWSDVEREDFAPYVG